MKRFSNLLLACLLLAVICAGAGVLCVAAAGVPAPQREVLAVSDRGDTAAAPANSLPAVLAAAERGADYISVEAIKTADGVFVLLTDSQKQTVSDAGEKTAAELQTLLLGGLSSQKLPTLAEVWRALDGRVGLIVDFDWNEREALCTYLKGQKIESGVLLRTAAPTEEILRFWQEADVSVPPLGVYRGNVIFRLLSHLRRLSEIGAPLVQAQSKNYFNVAFEAYAASRYEKIGAARMLAATCDEALCGKRADGISGWEELIARGFRAIETGCIEELNAYLLQRESCKTALQTALQEQREMPEAARQKAEAALAANATLSARQAALSNLRNADAAATTTTGPKPGTLQATPGRILAIALCGAGVLAWEIFVHRMQRKKEKTN